MKFVKRFHIPLLLNIVISAVIAMTIYITAYNSLQNAFNQYLNQQASLALEKLEVISDDTLKFLARLNSLNIQKCDTEALQTMRKMLFLTSLIKDIGFFDGKYMICTTGLGVLETPFLETTPDYKAPSGAQVWVNHNLILFNRTVQAAVIKSGRFNVVLRHDALQDLVPLNVDWEVVFSLHRVTTHIAGKPNIYDKAHLTGDLPPNLFFINICSQRIPYCVAIKASNDLFKQQYQLTLNGWKIISVLAFIGFFSVFSRGYKHYRSLQSRVVRGLNRGAFYCLYQPIVELDSGKIIGCEVLARYRDGKGDIYPDAFIPIIGKSKRTWSFTKQIIDSALRDIGSGADLPEKFKLNINFFAQDIESGNILDLLSYTQYDKKKLQLVIEVTENEQLSNAASAEVLSSLIDGGFQVAIDDFGTGYSNLRQIIDFKCHTLKIDRSFVSEMEAGSVRSTLIPHIVDIAGKINVDIVAEGIENSMQHQALINLGVKYGQGYMFGKPMSFDRFMALLKQN